MEMWISFSSRTARTTTNWFADHGITVAEWPANLPVLSPKENVWSILIYLYEGHQTEGLSTDQILSA